MKKLLIILSLIILSCTKEEIQKPALVCDFVFDKFYTTPYMDTTKSYWLRMAKDTLATGNGNTYKLQVQKEIWDTMLVNSSWERYCY